MMADANVDALVGQQRTATFRLKVSDPPVKTLFDRGLRVAAANHAELLAKSADENELRELVRVLAGAVRNIGDVHPGKGRPKSVLSTKTIASRAMASRCYRCAVLSRLLVDGDGLSADQLAALAWYLGLRPQGVPDGLLLDEMHRRSSRVIAKDMPGACDALKPYAAKFLAQMKLEPARVSRRGFRRKTLEKSAKQLGVTVDVLRRELAR